MIVHLLVFLRFWRGQEPDIVMLQNGSYPGSRIGVMACLAAKFSGAKAIVMVVHHGAVHNNMFRLVGEKVIDFLVQRLFTEIIAVSNATRDTLIRERGFDPSVRPIRVIHNGIDLADKNKAPASTWQPGAASSARSNGNILGMVGRVERYKGHEDLIIATSMLDHDQQKNISICFVGSVAPSEKDRLLKIKEALGGSFLIEFVGFVDGSVEEYIENFDCLFMLTKDFEGFGLTILEAMRLKTPVVSTDLAAVREFANDHEITFVPPENHYALACTISKLLSNPDVFEEKVPSAFKKAQHYSATIMAQSFGIILKTLN